MKTIENDARIVAETSRGEEIVLGNAITEYMDYYTNDRPQRGLGILTPKEYHEKLLLTA